MYDELKNCIERPIAISESMAVDTFLRTALKSEENENQEVVERQMVEYLAALKEKFGYLAAFVISEKRIATTLQRELQKSLTRSQTPMIFGISFLLDRGKICSWTRIEMRCTTTAGLCSLTLEFLILMARFHLYIAC